MPQQYIIPISSPNDKREYRALTLPNGLRVLLIHDAECTAAAAATASDPPAAGIKRRPGEAGMHSSDADEESLISRDEDEDEDDDESMSDGSSNGSEARGLLHAADANPRHPRRHPRFSALQPSVFSAPTLCLPSLLPSLPPTFPQEEEHEHVRPQQPGMHRHHAAGPTKRAAAALSCGVGSFTDPWHAQVI